MENNIGGIPIEDLIPLAIKYEENDSFNSLQKIALKISIAHCARISYTTLGDNPKIDYEADIKLHDRLLESKHLSCFEHCAKVMDTNEFVTFVKGQIDYLEIDEPNAGKDVAYNKVWNHDKEAGWCNNFRGFINYRYILENK